MRAHQPTIALITVPYDSGGTAVGTARAPAVLRQHNLVQRLQAVTEVIDYGDLSIATSGDHRDPGSGLIGEATFLKMFDDLRTIVARALRAGQFPLLIGGDCPILLSGLAAVGDLGRVPGLLFIDGHEDAYAPHESPTGETADMEYGFAVGLKTADWTPELRKRFPLIRKHDAILLAHRDLAVIRKDNASSVLSEVPHHSAKDLAKAPASIMRAALAQQLSAGVSGVWLHTDLDALSTKAMPAVDYKLPGGLDWAQLSMLVTSSFDDARVIGWDVTIYNPDLDPDEKLAPQIVDFISESIGALSADHSSL